MGDQGVLVTGGLRGLLGTGDVGSGSGDRRAWGSTGGTGPPGVLGGVCGTAGDAVSQEGAVETRGQVCTEPAERSVSGPPRAPRTPCPGSSEPHAGEGPAKERRLHRDGAAWPGQGWYLSGTPAAAAAARGQGLPAAPQRWRGRSPTGSCSATAGPGTGPKGWDWHSPGLRHRSARRCSAAAGRAPRDPQAQPGLSPTLHKAGGRTGPRRGRDIPLSEDEEEMERESSCSCRSTCRGDVAEPSVGAETPDRPPHPSPTARGDRSQWLCWAGAPRPTEEWGCSCPGLEDPAPQHPPCRAPWGRAAPAATLGTDAFPSAAGAGLGTHGAACAALGLGALGQLGGTAPVLAEQGLHAVDDVLDAVDEAIPLRLEDELVVDLVVVGLLSTRHSWAGPCPRPPSPHAP